MISDFIRVTWWRTTYEVNGHGVHCAVHICILKHCKDSMNSWFDFVNYLRRIARPIYMEYNLREVHLGNNRLRPYWGWTITLQAFVKCRCFTCYCVCQGKVNSLIQPQAWCLKKKKNHNFWCKLFHNNVVRHHESHIMSEKKYFSFWQIWILHILSFKLIYTICLTSL